MRKVKDFLCSLVVELLKAVRDVIAGKVPVVKGIRLAVGCLVALVVGVALLAAISHFGGDSMVSVVGKGKAVFSQPAKAKGEGFSKPQSPCSPQEPASLARASPSSWPVRWRGQ